MLIATAHHELRRRLTRRVTRVLLRAPRAEAHPLANVARADIRRVLICRPNHRLGNLVLLTPLLQALQQLLPAAKVDVVAAGADAATLFRTYSNVGRVYALSRRLVRHPLQTARIAWQTRQARYDLVIDPCPGSQSSRWLAAIAHASHVVGANGGASPGADVRLETAAAPPLHMAKWPVYMLRRAIAARDTGYPTLDLRLAPAERRFGGRILRALIPADAGRSRVVGVFADASGAKRYPQAWWMRCIDALQAQVPDVAVVEIEPPDGRSRLASRFPGFASRDVREVAAVISQMAWFISADCGVMHLACASGVPTLGLFSVTEVARYAPYGRGCCGIDTGGKDPEQVARELSVAMVPIAVAGITPNAHSPASG